MTMGNEALQDFEADLRHREQTGSTLDSRHCGNNEKQRKRWKLSDFTHPSGPFRRENSKLRLSTSAYDGVEYADAMKREHTCPWGSSKGILWHGGYPCVPPVRLRRQWPPKTQSSATNATRQVMAPK